eukprot:767350-Hanusia_phi.AAC.2
MGRVVHLSGYVLGWFYKWGGWGGLRYKDGRGGGLKKDPEEKRGWVVVWKGPRMEGGGGGGVDSDDGVWE